MVVEQNHTIPVEQTNVTQLTLLNPCKTFMIECVFLQFPDTVTVGFESL